MLFFLNVRFIMNITMKILFFILFASTATSLAQSTDPPPINHDITTLLNNSIAKTFRNLDAEMIYELIYNMKTDNWTNYYTEGAYNFLHFQNEFYFTGVNITPNVDNLESVHVRHAFNEAEMTIFLPKLTIKVEGYLETSNDTVHATFQRVFDFQNISIVAYKVPNHLRGEKLCFYMEYEKTIKSFNYTEIKFHPNLEEPEQEQLVLKIEKILLPLLLNTLQHNEKFLRSLNATFCNHPKKEITSRYPDFQNNADQYHYFIPNITSLQRTLSNITITGLWNFQSHSFSFHSDQIATNLTIKNIRGNASLHYGSQNSTIFPLHFEAGFISILLDEETERGRIIAYNYSVSQTNLNSSLTKYQSKWVMEGIELAIASSIMPSIKVYRNRNESLNGQRYHPIVQISTKMSQQFHGNTIQKLYHDWNISIIENITTESNLQFESSNYSISIWCTPNLQYGPTPSSYPDWIRCDLYDTLQISFKIPLTWVGKVRISNSTHQFDDRDFITNGNIFVALLKRNRSKENDDFELTTTPNENMEVNLSAHRFNITASTGNFFRAMIKKITQMLSSSILHMVKDLAKPLLSLPLDYCIAPVKIFDDFLPFFADHELPYYVPDANNNPNNPPFPSDVNNIVIEEWTKFPNTTISFYKTSGKNLSSVVDIELGKTKVRMNYNDTSVQSNELKRELVFRNAVLKNFTNILGEIGIDLYHYDDKSKYDEFWLRIKLERIIAESFKNLTKAE